MCSVMQAEAKAEAEGRFKAVEEWSGAEREETRVEARGAPEVIAALEIAERSKELVDSLISSTRPAFEKMPMICCRKDCVDFWTE